jgi:hypothetical protein
MATCNYFCKFEKKVRSSLKKSKKEYSTSINFGSFIIESEDNYEDGDSIELDVEYSETAHCCGVVELGDIDVQDENKGLIKEEWKIEYIKLLLLHLFKNETSGKSCKLFQFTIPIRSYRGKIIEDYLLFEKGAIAAGFECVAEFKNSNSGNLLRHYIKYKL